MAKHRAIFEGSVQERYYYVRHYGFDCRRVARGGRLASWKKIWEGDIDSPLLEKGEFFYINDLDLKVQILKKVRTVTGDYIYETDYIAETIDNIESKAEAEEEMLEIEQREKAIKQEAEERFEKARNSQYTVECMDVKSSEEKSWFERWFG